MSIDASTPDIDRVVSRLLERLLELEATIKPQAQMNEALRGVKANQLDARGNRGGIWYVVESRWSIVAIAIACVALGIAIASGGNLLTQLMESRRELSRELRLKTQAIDELRLENRAVLRAAGIEPEPLENHDISELAAKAVKGKP